MKKLESLRIVIKKVAYCTVEISPENGYEDFPDTALAMHGYIQDIKDNVIDFYDDVIEDEVEITLVDIEEKYTPPKVCLHDGSVV